MAIFSTRPSYSWSPSRRKYVRDCGLETTAIIPLGARTIPSSRRVLTCSPALPAGRGPVLPPACSRPISDSKGSRLATLGSLSTAEAEVAADPAGFAVFGADFLALCFCAGFCSGFDASAEGFAACAELFAFTVGAAGLAPEAAALLAPGAVALFCPEAGAAAGFAGVCASGFAAGLPTGFALCGAGFAAAGGAGFVPVPLAGFACACRLGTAAASVIPSTRVFTKRIFRSFPFRVSPPVSPRLSKRRRHSAW